MYIHTLTYTYVHIHMHMHIHMFIHIIAYIYIYTPTQISIERPILELNSLGLNRYNIIFYFSIIQRSRQSDKVDQSISYSVTRYSLTMNVEEVMDVQCTVYSVHYPSLYTV